MKSTTLLLPTFFAVISLGTAANSAAQPPPNSLVRVQSHAGQMDTDGILSPGERKNPNIDYDSAHRHAERHGDQRVENPINDHAARDDRRYKYDDRDYHNREGEQAARERDHERDERRDRDDQYERKNSWWNW